MSHVLEFRKLNFSTVPLKICCIFCHLSYCTYLRSLRSYSLPNLLECKRMWWRI